MSLSRRRLLRGTLLLALPALTGSGYLATRARGQGGHTNAAPEDICIVAPTFAHDPASGLSPLEAREVPEQARCPVCGMFPARQRRWAAQVIFTDGQAQFLDSPLSLFHYLQQVSRYTPGRQATEIASVYVSDYATSAWLDANEALYLHESSLLGPMRAGNLPAFSSQAAAQPFRARHGGALLRLASLRKQLPQDLQKLAPHSH
ncbi:MAG: hypothetical protein C0423_16315 [Methylibium sp.]|nr:hypothetical protein [Methylibium sp.]